MKYAIVINTYYRSDGKTKEHLSRALNSVRSQTYSDYVVFLIGDRYTHEQEFDSFREILPTEKMITVNLPYAKERELYFDDREKLHCSGGVNARNIGIEMALESGFSFVLNLDHDDYWSSNHLERINEAITKYPEAAFVCTKATHGHDGRAFLPNILPQKTISEFYPIPYSIINSSTCINFKKIPLRYTDVYATHGYPHPSDAFLWISMKKYMIENSLSGYLYNELTCFHEEENRANISNKIIVTKKSIATLNNIVQNMVGSTFHHHYHINYDIRSNFQRPITYVEIGAYSGASACLMLSHESQTKVISIDIGSPISKEIVFENVHKFKKINNRFTYIQGDSSKEETVSKLLNELNGNSIEILFIDGDHTYDAVLKDFELYSKYISPGGYIVFDDYLDWEHSPDVKFAVDEIVENRLNNDFFIVGTMENILYAKPIELMGNNCFVIQKCPNVYVEKHNGFPKVLIHSLSNESYEVSFFGITDGKESCVHRTHVKSGMAAFAPEINFENWKVRIDNKLEFLV